MWSQTDSWYRDGFKHFVATGIRTLIVIVISRHTNDWTTLLPLQMKSQNIWSNPLWVSYSTSSNIRYVTISLFDTQLSTLTSTRYMIMLMAAKALTSRRYLTTHLVHWKLSLPNVPLLYNDITVARLDSRSLCWLHICQIYNRITRHCVNKSTVRAYNCLSYLLFVVP